MSWPGVCWDAYQGKWGLNGTLYVSIVASRCKLDQNNPYRTRPSANNKRRNKDPIPKPPVAL